MFGKARMEMKAGLTFACMNLKKLAKLKAKWGLLEEGEPLKISILYTIRLIREKWLWDTNPRAALSTVCPPAEQVVYFYCDTNKGMKSACAKFHSLLSSVESPKCRSLYFES